MTHVSVINVGCKEHVGSCEAVYITTQRCIVLVGIIYDIYIYIYLLIYLCFHHENNNVYMYIYIYHI